MGRIKCRLYIHYQCQCKWKGLCYLLLPWSPLPTSGRVRAKDFPRLLFNFKVGEAPGKTRIQGREAYHLETGARDPTQAPLRCSWDTPPSSNCSPQPRLRYRSQLGQGKLWVLITGKCIRGWHPAHHFTRLARPPFLSKICPWIKSLFLLARERPLTKEHAGSPLIIA